MQGSPTSGYPTTVNNPPCYFSGRCDIGSSISTSSFELSNTSKEELISFFLPYLNWTRKLFLRTTLWKRTTNFYHPPHFYLPCGILQLSNLGLYKRPHTNFCISLILYLHPLFKSENKLYHDGLGRGRGGLISISVANSERIIDLFFVLKVIPTNNKQAKTNCPGVENQ